MHLCSYHFPVKEKTFQHIRETLLDKGLVSVIDDLGDKFRPYSEHLDIDIPAPVIRFADADILATQDKQCLCRVELLRQAPGETLLELYVLSSGPEPEQQLVTRYQEVCGHTGIKGTVREVGLAKTLKERLSKLSTNGKMLANRDFVRALEGLYERRTRDLLRPIARAFRNITVPQSVAANVFDKDEDRKKFHTLLNNASLFSRQYLIGCEACQAEVPHFMLTLQSIPAFINKEDAETVLQQLASKKCASCRRPFGIIDGFAMTEGAYRGLEQGLWLEYLVYRTVEPLSMFSAAGRTLETFELDVVSLFCESIILFECTEGSFGETDYARLIMKADAEGLNTNVIGIVTTQPLHKNVKGLVDREEKDGRHKVLRIAGLSNAEEIRTEIEHQLKAFQRSYAKDIFSPVRRFPYERHFRAARTLRYYY